jgi:hypothetical protein
MRVVLNGWGAIPTGLGTELRWLWKLLPFDAWYQRYHSILGWGNEVPGKVYRDWQEIEADVVVGVERIEPQGLARNLNARIVVLANPESNAAVQDWKPYADLVVARTNQAHQHFQHIGIPSIRMDTIIDVEEFPYRERSRVERIVFTNGWGGTHLRKGWPEVERMLRLSPNCVEVYSQRPLPKVRHHGPVASSQDLYAEADLILMPSRFEGLGLTMLEAMASGCLVAATRAEPMSEFMYAAYGPLAEELLLPVEDTNVVTISRQAWTANYVHPQKALDVLQRVRALPTAKVEQLSYKGREYVERTHGKAAATALWKAITKTA